MNARVRPPVVFLMGPTAAGKTALALALHEHLPVDIVSVDAAQVYRGLDIGTAKPSRAERARAPHRLIDIREPEEPYSAAAFRADAMREIADIHARGRIPLLVGGTLFYFHALEFGLPPTPAADPALRAEIAREAAQAGWAALHARLARLDPARAARIHPHDAQRIQRALEICRLTGAPASAQARPAIAPAFEILRLALMPVTRGALAARIETRFQAMLRDGLIEEVKVLYQRGNLSPTLPSIRTVGYRQVWQYLDGAIDYNEMVSRAVYGTRQLAKRQLTWLRSYPGVQALKADDDAVVSRASALIRQMPEQRV